MKLEVQVREVYGRELIYPVNEAAKLAVQLTGRKTFFEVDLNRLQALGHEVEFIPRTVDLSGKTST